MSKKNRKEDKEFSGSLSYTGKGYRNTEVKKEKPEPLKEGDLVRFKQYPMIRIKKIFESQKTSGSITLANIEVKKNKEEDYTFVSNIDIRWLENIEEEIGSDFDVDFIRGEDS